MNLIDLLAIVPFYVDLALTADSSSVQTLRILRIVRLARIFRLLKVGRYLGFLKVFKMTLLRSSEPLILLLLFVFLLSVIFGSIVATIEAGECVLSTDPCVRSDGSVSPYKNYLVGIYWAITTLTTVGYGDTFPVEGGGRFIANIAMITGILIFALPLAVIGSNFQNAFQEYEDEKTNKAKVKLRSETLIQNSAHASSKHRSLIREIKRLLVALKHKEEIALKNRDGSLIQNMLEREMEDVSLFFESTLQILKNAEESIMKSSDKLQDLLQMESTISSNNEAGMNYPIPEEKEIEYSQ
jgi:voltage-gated potassium channel Kch